MQSDNWSFLPHDTNIVPHRENSVNIGSLQRLSAPAPPCLAQQRTIKEAAVKLEGLGIVPSKATGREKVCCPGGWVEISEKKDGSVRKEWFYPERVFTGRGAENCTAEVQPVNGAENRTPVVQEAAPTNREENRESVSALQMQRKDPEHVRYLVDEILAVCGDEKSRTYYIRLASRLPDDLIFRALAEIRQSGIGGGAGQQAANNVC